MPETLTISADRCLFDFVAGTMAEDDDGVSGPEGMTARDPGSSTETSRYRRRSFSAKAARNICEIWRNSELMSASSAEISAIGATYWGESELGFGLSIENRLFRFGRFGRAGGPRSSSAGSSFGSILGERRGGESGRRFRSINGIEESMKERIVYEEWWKFGCCERGGGGGGGLYGFEVVEGRKEESMEMLRRKGWH